MRLLRNTLTIFLEVKVRQIRLVIYCLTFTDDRKSFILGNEDSRTVQTIRKNNSSILQCNVIQAWTHQFVVMHV